jgi:CxxC motif-containing protein (DUF1111 family)
MKMKKLKLAVVVLFTATLLLPSAFERVAEGQSEEYEGPPTGQANVALNDSGSGPCAKAPIAEEEEYCPDCPPPTEAPTGFDDMSNGFIKQGEPPAPGEEPERGTFVQDKLIFEERDVKEDGLGPVYNAQACSECHQNPTTGGVSQIMELRAGHLAFDQDLFIDPPGGSLINDRAVDAGIQERVPPVFSRGINQEEQIRTTRTSLNLLGDGFVEAIADKTLQSIADSQPHDAGSGGIVRGQVISVPVEETRGPYGGGTPLCRVGRFGHKNQHASLLSFSGDAYLNEIGITNRLFTQENTSLGRFVGLPPFDLVPDGRIRCIGITNDPGPNIFCAEDRARDVDTFTEFMRATKAPPRDADVADTRDAQEGARLFEQISCTVCHVPTIRTARPGTLINAGKFVVPDALGNKLIHPYGDFLLHDIGTGDGIVQNGGFDTRLKVRTAPLWGVRTHTRLMHDGASLTFIDAISRHGGEAAIVRQRFFNELSEQQRRQLIIFLESL